MTSASQPVDAPKRSRTLRPRWTNRDYLVRARRIMGMRWSYEKLWDFLWDFTGFPFVGMRMTMIQLRHLKRYGHKHVCKYCGDRSEW